MLSGDLAALLAETFSVPIGMAALQSKRLRAKGLLSKRGRGPLSGAKMTERDATNWLLALAIDHRRGEDVAENVLCVRALPFHHKHELDRDFAGELSFTRAETLGGALDALLRDMRGGGYRQFEHADPAYPLDLTFFLDAEDGEASIVLARTRALAGAASWNYRSGSPHARPVWRHVNIRGAAFEQIAAGLGPITKSDSLETRPGDLVAPTDSALSAQSATPDHPLAPVDLFNDG